MAHLPITPDVSRSGWDHFRPLVFSHNTDLKKYDQITHPTLHALSEKVGNYYWDNSPDKWLVLPAYNADVAGVWAARTLMVITDKGPTVLRAIGLAAAACTRAIVTALLGLGQYFVVAAIVFVLFVIGVPLYVLFEILSKVAEKTGDLCREIYRYFTNYYIKKKVADLTAQNASLHSENASLKHRIEQLGAGEYGDGTSALRLDGMPDEVDEEDIEDVEKVAKVDSPVNSSSNTAKKAGGLPNLSLSDSPLDDDDDFSDISRTEVANHFTSHTSNANNYGSFVPYHDPKEEKYGANGQVLPPTNKSVK